MHTFYQGFNTKTITFKLIDSFLTKHKAILLSDQAFFKKIQPPDIALSRA